MGPVDEGGQGHGLAGAGSARSRWASRSSRSRPTRSPTRSRRPTRACCAAAWRTTVDSYAGQGAARRDRRRRGQRRRDRCLCRGLCHARRPRARTTRRRAGLPVRRDGRPHRCATRGGGGRWLPVLFMHGFGGDLDNWLFNIDPACRDGSTSMRSICPATANPARPSPMPRSAGCRAPCWRSWTLGVDGAHSSAIRWAAPSRRRWRSDAPARVRRCR